ncbi:MAG TPA: SHOCT domain-containing protein [Marmoricola sp.]
MMWDNGDGRWDRMHDGGAGWFMVLLMIVLVVAVVVAAVAILRGTVPSTHAAPAAPAPRGADPRAILQERLARGEIDEDDFRARMRALDEAGPASG